MPLGIPEIVKNIVPASVRTTIRSSYLGKILNHIKQPHDSIYSEYYYEKDVEPSAVQGATVMAKSIVDRFQPKTVIDVGCGTGALLEAFLNLNCQVCGLEYSEAGLAYCKRRKLPVRKFNIAKDRINSEQYDVAVSFEVAEHLLPWVADKFVALLCDLSPVVVISAATPGQSGTDHVNEQPICYWIKKFQKLGYVLDKKSADRFSSDWKFAGTASWYHSNILVFVRQANFLCV